MKVKRFYEPVLTTDVIFITDSTPIEIEKWVKKNYKATAEGYDSLAGSVTLLDEIDKQGRKTREYLIIVEDKKGFYTLLHEIVHLVDHIFNDRQIPIERENSEIRAYYQSYWFRTLWRFMNNTKIIKKRT